MYDYIHTMYVYFLFNKSFVQYISLTKSPALCMLGISPIKLHIHGLNKLCCRLSMLTGCTIIVTQWQAVTPSSFERWIELMTNIAGHERVISRLSGRRDLFWTTWGPFLDRIYNIRLRTDLILIACRANVKRKSLLSLCNIGCFFLYFRHCTAVNNTVFTVYVTMEI